MQSVYSSRYALLQLEVDAAIGHGRAMSRTRNGLSVSNHTTNYAALLVPMIILMIQASVSMSNETNSHVQGTAALLQACGPQAFTTSQLRSAFFSCRSTLVTIGTRARRRTFLAEDAWRSIPWAGQPFPKSSQDQLVDVLSTVPGFLQDLELLQKRSLVSFGEWEEFCLRLRSSLIDLYR